MRGDQTRLERVFGVSLCALTLGAAVVISTAGASASAVGCKRENGTQLRATPSYHFALRLGKAEKMYTRAQVRAMHPTSGEVMLSGSMVMGGMVMSSMRHLEVQICSRKGSAVITNAHPTIMVVDTTAKGRPVLVPIAVMEGVGEGVADLHYGNNVTMPAGHKFTVTVKVKGEHVGFRVTSPKAR